MDERWYYRYFDREVGPLDFRSLQALADSGQIGKEDVVRTDTARAWVKARTIPNLFTQAASVDDLDAMLESAGSAEPSRTSSAASSGVKREEGCYCLVLGRELGPMSFEELGELARKGELTPRHKVRIRANADWIEAGSIVGLFEERPHGDTSDLMASAPAAEAADFELQRSTSVLAPQRRSDSDVETIDREWFWKLMGNETGPFTFEAVHELAQNGRLSRTDQIRCGRAGAWVPADSIVGLFPDEAGEFDDEPEEEDDEFRYEDFVEDAVGQQQKRKARAAGRRKSGRRDNRHGTPRKPTRSEPESKRPAPVPTMERAPAAPEPVQARPEPAPLPSPMYVAPPSLPTPAKPVPVPMKTKRSFDSGGMNINWKYVGIGAAVVLVGVGLWQFGLPSFGGGTEFGSGVVGETLTIWNEAVLLHQPEYEGARWDEFKERTLPRVKELAAELEKEGGTDAEAQALLKCHKEYLPAILEAGPTRRTQEWTDMANCVATLSS